MTVVAVLMGAVAGPAASAGAAPSLGYLEPGGRPRLSRLPLTT